MGGEVGANLQKIFAYGLRNSFGMAFDPRTGDLWEQENGDDSFSELNRVDAGLNSGWIQIMGPAVAGRAVQGDRDRPDGAAAVHARTATSASSSSAGRRRTSPTPRPRRFAHGHVPGAQFKIRS